MSQAGSRRGKYKTRLVAPDTTGVDPGTGDPDAPVGTESWARNWRLATQSALARSEIFPDALLRQMKMGWKNRVWELLTDKDGKHFQSLAQFSEYEQPWGLGKKYDEVRHYLAARLGDRALQLEEVGLPQTSPGRGHVGEKNPHHEGSFGAKTSERLRAINRAPEQIRDLYREGRISQTVASRLGPKNPTPDQSARITEVTQAVRGLKDRREVDARVKDMLGEKPPSRVDRAEKVVRALKPAELRELFERLRDLMDPRRTSKDR
jgi:hypothetical protein